MVQNYCIFLTYANFPHKKSAEALFLLLQPCLPSHSLINLVKHPAIELVMPSTAFQYRLRVRELAETPFAVISTHTRMAGSVEWYTLDHHMYGHFVDAPAAASNSLLPRSTHNAPINSS